MHHMIIHLLEGVHTKHKRNTTYFKFFIEAYLYEETSEMSTSTFQCESMHLVLNISSLKRFNQSNQITVYQLWLTISTSSRYPIGFVLCHLHVSSHISLVPNSASHPNKSFAFFGSAYNSATSPGLRGAIS